MVSNPSTTQESKYPSQPMEVKNHDSAPTTIARKLHSLQGKPRRWAPPSRSGEHEDATYRRQCQHGSRRQAEVVAHHREEEPPTHDLVDRILDFDGRIGNLPDNAHSTSNGDRNP